MRGRVAKVDAQEHDTARRPLRVRGVQRRLLVMAGSTPRRPEDQHHRTAAERRDADVLAGQRRAAGRGDLRRGDRGGCRRPARGSAQHERATEQRRSRTIMAAPPPRSTPARSSTSNQRMPRYSSAMRNGTLRRHPHDTRSDLLIREEAEPSARHRVCVERMASHSRSTIASPQLTTMPTSTTTPRPTSDSRPGSLAAG